MTKIHRRASRSLTAAVALCGLLATWSVAVGAAPSTPLTTDWEKYFVVEAQSAQVGGRTVVYGTIRNVGGFNARRIQLLVDGVDAAGAVVNQRVEWLGPDLSPGSHTQFQVAAPGPAARYRVSVFAYDKYGRN